MMRTPEEEAAVAASIAASTARLATALAAFDRAHPARARLRAMVWGRMDAAARAYGEAVEASGRGIAQLRAGRDG